jgi:dinuclear metal center YbgI/SA1388 family protein
MAEIEHILQFLDESFESAVFPDYPNALNGLQVEGKRNVERVAVAVDASEQTIKEAGKRGVDLLVVHHGLFWGGLGPLTGSRYRKIRTLMGEGINLYSLHLPLDAHRELGNNVLLLRGLGLEPEGQFGLHQGVEIGWWARADTDRDTLAEELRTVLGGEVRLIPGGPERIQGVGVVTGSGVSALEEAVTVGLDALITGEAPHHAYHDAMELGINLLLGGHYATETLGVKAVGAALAEKFSLSSEFIDFPTGL